MKIDLENAVGVIGCLVESLESEGHGQGHCGDCGTCLDLASAKQFLAEYDAQAGN